MNKSRTRGNRQLLAGLLLLALGSSVATAATARSITSNLATLPAHNLPRANTAGVSLSRRRPAFVVDALRGGAADGALDTDESSEESSSEEPPIRQQVDQSEATGEDSDGSNAVEAESEDEHPTTDLSADVSESLSSLPAVVETTTTTVLQDALSDGSISLPEDSSDYSEDGGALGNQDELLDQASSLRVTGKELHDQGNFAEAAVSFGAAADILTPLLQQEEEDLTEEFATCRLHEALCRLKAEEFEEASTACSEVLGLHGDSVAPALRARAFHRRAKAQLELGDSAGALQDARSASFLGDRKAVALYGKLMRESSPGSSASLMSTGSDNMPSSSDGMAASSALLESLLSKSSGSSPSLLGASSGDDSGGLPFSPLSLLSMGQSGAGQGGLAKSVLTSLSKRIDDEKTQETLCQYLQGASAPQLQQMAGMAGMQLQRGQAEKIAGFCNSVTPKMIRRTVKLSKRAVYSVQLVRKILKLISKYRNILVLLVLIAWIKSAINRPIPVNKKAIRRAAKEAAKAAIAAAI